MTRRIRYVGSVGAVVAVIVAAGWAAAAQTGGHGAPAAQGTQGVANPLQGFSQNSGQPIKIESTSLEVRDKDHLATFIGNVHVVQGDTTMTCKTLVVYYDQSAGPTAAPQKSGPSGSGNQQIKRLEAKGGVVITQKEQTATGDSGVFDMKTNTATLIGNVVVTQGQNVVRGDKLVVDMTTGVSRVEAGKSTKGRVEGLFLPNSPPGGQPGSAPGGGAKEAKPSAPLKIN
ncbi:MAG TPA: LptA/OstA family protein [Xanthobacteraceae bacterium]|jgi:lipopolysaccharide export system protein LptA|nr:LptA/OstA family protein [Xanthobacteraceae bacterium]